MLHAAVVTVWVTGPAHASDMSSPDIAHLLTATAWRAAHAACAACALACLHLANALLYTGYDDLCASADAARRRAELRVALPFVTAANAVMTTISAVTLAVTTVFDVVTVTAMVMLLSAHATVTLATRAARFAARRTCNTTTACAARWARAL